MNGILNICKPAGITSFGVVSAVRRLIGEKRVGHAGTLDPMAEGVLPICFGKATRVIEYLQEDNKLYRAEIVLGTSTDSYDAAGKITMQADYSSVSRRQLEKSLEGFRGDIQQTPPMFSAVKHNGQRLYSLAREGVSVERKSRPAHIYRLDLVSFKPPLVVLDIECSRGTYIRSLAHDLGEALGCGAHVSALARLAYGPFIIEDAVSPSLLETAVKDNDWQKYVYAIDSVLQSWQKITVDDEKAQLIRYGSGIDITDIHVKADVTERCLAYDNEDDLLAILVFDAEKDNWHPQKVFA